jgi:hypothetical protein
MPMAAICPRGLGGDEVDVLLLDDGVEVLEEAHVVGRNGLVVLPTGHVEELHRRRVVLLRQRVDLEVRLDVLRGRLDTVSHVAAHEVPHGVGPRLHHEVAVRHVAVVARGQHQVLAALAPIRAGRTHVGDVAEVHVVEDAEDVRRDLDHGGTVLLEVEESPGVERGVVPGQHQRLGVAHLLGDDDLVRPGVPEVSLPLADVEHRHRREHVDEDLDGARPVHVVVDLLRRVADRHPVEELEGAGGRLHPVRGGDAVGNSGGVLVRRLLDVHRSLCPGGCPQQASEDDDGEGLGFHLSSPDYLGNRNLIENCRVQSGAWSGRTTLW